ncbi:MAG: hypothetical protein JNK02_11290 [Planctomycetes bacterium]|nr:hypothetical protein [Planctomycetota bacterium]
MNPLPDLDAVEALCRQSRFVAALRLGEGALPLGAWPGARGQALAGRIANWTGAPRLGSALHLRAARRHPDQGLARLHGALALLHDRGPVAALARLEGGVESEADPAVRAELHAARALARAELRDFERAELDLARARALGGEQTWIHVAEARVLEGADRYDAALAAAERALAEVPGYASAVACRARLLQLADRAHEAAEFLARAVAANPCAPHAGLLTAILLDLERDEDAARALDAFEAAAPLRERLFTQWIAACRSELAWRRGDHAASLQHALRVDAEFHRRRAASVARASGTRRRSRVAFVRQHHETCGPATLAALAGAFGRQADQLQIAERIAWGGSTGFHERCWAEGQGFLVREFTVTWEGARSLLDRDLPFGVGTAEASTGHMQAVIGYDTRRDTLLVRDPYQPELREWPQAEFFARYGPTGPRGILLLPPERAAECAQLPLHEAELHDALHRVQAALEAHERAAAERQVEELQARAPRSFLARMARYVLAAYDQDGIEQARVVEELLAEAPTCGRFLFMQAGQLARQERSAELREVLARAARLPGADRVFDVRLAEELARDARRAATAWRHIRRALRRPPPDASALRVLALLHEHAGDREQAIEALRSAACLDESQPEHAERYAALCQSAGRGSEALAFLAARAERHARRSSQPARSFAAALERAGRIPEALLALERAREARPDDGDLALEAALLQARHGRFARAHELLDDAERRVRRPDALRARALVALAAGEVDRAREQLRAAQAAAPHDAAILALHLNLVLATSGPGELGAVARAALATRPHDAQLRRLVCELLGPHAPQEAEVHLRELLARHPDDAWARRELALRLLDGARLDEAEAEARRALDSEPARAASQAVLGLVLVGRGQREAARAAFERACALDADDETALHGALVLATEAGQGRAGALTALARIAAQAVSGGALPAWSACATGVLEPAELVAELEALRAARGDLPAAHRALAGALRAHARWAEARAVARHATERFPLDPGAWLELAGIERALGSEADERAALERAAAVGPRDGSALRALAAQRARLGAPDEALALLERAAGVAPLEFENHAALAAALAAAERPEEALRRAEILVRLRPRDMRAWAVHRAQAQAALRPERTLELLVAASAAQPGDVRLRLLLAQHLPREQAARRETLLRALLADHPGEFDALDLLAEDLGDAGRAAEALELLEQHAAAHPGSPQLAGRRAWLLGRCGRREEAAAGLAALVDAQPAYRWAAERLDEVLAELDRHDERRRRLEERLRREPNDPAWHDALARVAEARGEAAAAEASHRRALELEPDRWGSVASLVDLLAARSALEEARAILASVPAGAPPWLRPRAELRLACAARELRGAVEVLRAAGEDPRNAGPVLTWIALPLLEAGHHELGREVLDELLARPGGLERVGPAWVTCHARAKRHAGALARLGGLPATTPGWTAAVEGLLEDALANEAAESVRPFVEAHADALQGHPDLWALVSRVHLSLDQDRELLHWTATWRRPGARPWMLVLPVLARLHPRDQEQALEIAEFALELAPDHATPHHAVLAAALVAARGDFEGARSRLARAPREAEHADLLAALATLLRIALAALDEPDRRAGYRGARRALRTHAATLRAYARVPLVRALRRACLAAIARRRGTALARVWALTRAFG